MRSMTTGKGMAITGNRGIVDDYPTTLFQHGRYFMLHAQPYALEIGIHYCVERLVCFVGKADPLFYQDACIVKGYIQFP